jgi:prevent-host-death family protein
MSLSLLEDIHPVTDLKRKTGEILQQIHRTGRPVILTVNGRADAVLIDAKTYEKHLTALDLARLVFEGEDDIAAGRMRGARTVLREWLQKSREL